MDQQQHDTEKALHSNIHIIDYSPTGLPEEMDVSIKDLPEQKQTSRWIMARPTLGNLEEIRLKFGVHPLVLEDIQNYGNRPKLEGHNDYVHLALNIVGTGADNSLIFEHVDILLGANWIITLHENPEILSPLIERIKSCVGWTCQNGPDYLCYAIIDLALDSYYEVLESFGEKIEDCEDAAVENPTPEILEHIRELKKQALLLRKSIWPVRDMLSSLEHGQYLQFKQETFVYLRNALNHVHQIIDTIETYRDIISGMHDIYLTSVSHKLNEIMKLLTIISTIFIPLTFISSIYGMNFENMPELKHQWGYPGVLIIMGVMAIGMLIVFKKRKWL